MNEAQTKYELIEPALRAAGWGSVEGSKILLEFPITRGRIIGKDSQGKVRRKTQLSADYVLEYNNRRLAIIEAKKRDLYYTEGLAQAKDYADRLDIRFTYSTNGKQIYGVDMDEGTEGDVETYPSPMELWNLTFPPPKEESNKKTEYWKDRLYSVPFEDRGGTWQPRYYQSNAINKAIDAVAERKDRILLTLATGTGKTAISFQISWKLYNSKWNLQRDGRRTPRILFLADRNILADQAFNAYSNAFEEEALVRINPAEIRKKNKVPKNGSIFFTIFQTFMSGPEGSPYFGDYEKDFFDFIIIDECHRGGANDESTWRDILEYFSPAVQLGLTATPKRDVNKDTYKYFNQPVYVYSLKAGINDGFLTPFKVSQVSSTIDEYVYTGDDEVIDGPSPDIGQKFTEEQMNRVIEIREREEFRVKKFLSMINQNQKTIVFCATQVHAAAVRDLINQYSKSKSPNYCQRVTADDGKLGEQHLKDFQDNEKTIPTILTTSQKLSTGVDAPEVRNIVLMRPVQSMVEFKQIVGRGTRLFDSKDYFTIYDFVNAHEHFNDPEWDGEPLEPQIKESDPGGKKEDILVHPPDPQICKECNNLPCVCDKPPKPKIRIKLSDNSIRELDSMVKTTFWDERGQPISANRFLENLFGDLPNYFGSEEELRKIWSVPSTRRKLLSELSDRGYTIEQLEDLRKIISAEKSDIFDVLNYVAYHRNVIPRLHRATKAKATLYDYNPQQQDFLNFVLDQYIRDGFTELDDNKLPDLLELKYKTLTDAKKQLGTLKLIRQNFIEFQNRIYFSDVV